jgi:hypothetical protein
MPLQSNIMTTKQIGKAIRKARGQRSIREVARSAGLHRDQVTGIEQATKAYTMPVFLKLVKALGGWEFVLQAKGSEAAFTNGATGSKDVRG